MNGVWLFGEERDFESKGKRWPTWPWVNRLLASSLFETFWISPVRLLLGESFVAMHAAHTPTAPCCDSPFLPSHGFFIPYHLFIPYLYKFSLQHTSR